MQKVHKAQTEKKHKNRITSTNVPQAATGQPNNLE